MHELVKNLRHKEYNLCGELTGYERRLCNRLLEKGAFDGLTNYLYEFKELMHKALEAELKDLEHEKNFPNESALVGWALYDLNEVEWHVVIKFDESSPLQVGLSKYLTHVLYENRYNIHYNALVDYFQNKADNKIFDNAVKHGVTPEDFEQKLNSVAQEADYSSKCNELNAKLLKLIGWSGNSDSDNTHNVLEFLFDIFSP